MDNNLLIATPMSRADIRKIANSIREKFGLEKKLKFRLIEFVEFIMPKFIDKEFYLEIVSINEMPNCYAQAIPEEHKIILREDVYERILRGDPRSCFTLAHEVGHYILHRKENILVLNRRDTKFNNIVIPKYQDPEWQANTFAGELLVPYGQVAGLTINQISINCGVSMQVAQIQFNENKKGS